MLTVNPVFALAQTQVLVCFFFLRYLYSFHTARSRRLWFHHSKCWNANFCTKISKRTISTPIRQRYFYGRVKEMSLQRFGISLYFFPPDEDGGCRREEVPATDFGSAEEGAHHLPGHPEETVQTVQGEN